jgi:hypothetical protein
MLAAREQRSIESVFFLAGWTASCPETGFLRMKDNPFAGEVEIGLKRLRGLELQLKSVLRDSEEGA